MNIITNTIDDYLIVTLQGELDHHTSENLRKKVDKLYYNENLLNIILDLNGLNFMDSSGIGFIMGRYKNCKERGGSLSVISTSPNIERILRMSGILKLVKIYPTINEIIKA